ncbi:MAG: DHH family phosphoesterase [Acidimicrobiales bacterium]
MSGEFDRAVAVIGAAPSLALACHVNPDGDALGSMLAFHLLCRANGKESVASWAEPLDPGPQYRFLPGLELATKPADFPAEPEVMVCFDCGSPGRLGDLRRSAAAAGTLVVVDHHATNTGYGTVNVVDADAAATVVLVHRLAQRLGWVLDREVATCLYAGLVTDTGRFQYDCTTPDTFALARELTGFGLPIASMSRQLFDQHRFSYLQLVARCLQRAVLDLDLRLVATWVTARDLDEFDCDLPETEGLIDVVRGTAEAEVSCVLKEAPDGVRVSLRSVSEVDVGALAGRFGGGGHRHAAGFVARTGSVADVLAAVRAELAELVPVAAGV